MVTKGLALFLGIVYTVSSKVTLCRVLCFVTDAFLRDGCVITQWWAGLVAILNGGSGFVAVGCGIA
jgi:hypothetical protein